MTGSADLERKAGLLTGVVALQLLAALFFFADVADDIARDGWGIHVAVEAGAVLALLAGILFGAWQIRALLLRARLDAAAVAKARGAMGDLIRRRFEQWHLTPAEADVALFALKGCDIAEIAALRGSASGTIRAQLARVYAKAGIRTQSALIAAFIDDLIDTEAAPGGITARTPQTPPLP